MTISDLYQAYRKAKQEAWRDRLFSQAEEFAAYEKHLTRNLGRLLGRLNRDDSWANDLTFWGEATFYLKSAEAPASPPRVVRSSLPPGKLRSVEFRRVLRPSVDAHIVSALWIRHAGDYMDSNLSRCARGNRLRRLKGQFFLPGEYHVHATEIFKSYHRQYSEWRDDALRTALAQLKKQSPVTLITLDISRFYESVDPEIFRTRGSLESLLGSPIDAQSFKWRFHRAFISGLILIARSYGGEQRLLRGIPIGLSASHLLANIALAPLDRRIIAMRPLYYGRYVDDLIVVLRASQAAKQPSALLQKLGAKVDSKWRLHITPCGRGEYIVKEEKTRVFELAPDGGEEVISAIRKAASEITSEARLFPDFTRTSPSEEALLEVTGADGLTTGILRVGDAVTLRRLSLGVMLSRYEAMGKFVSPQTWARQRDRLYRVAKHQLFRADRLVEYGHYLLRLITFAAAMGDLPALRTFVRSLLRSLTRVKQDTEEIRSAEAYEAVMRRNARDALLKGVGTSRRRALYSTATTLVRRLATNSTNEGENAVQRKAKAIFDADLAWTPVKTTILDPQAQKASTEVLDIDQLTSVDDPAEAQRRRDVTEFVDTVGGAGAFRRRLLFPTRPLTTLEISFAVRAAAGDARLWARYVHALRGVWVSPRWSADQVQGVITIPTGIPDGHNVGVAVASWLTSDQQWKAAAKGKPDLGYGRLKRLGRLLNMAIKMRGRPQYFVMPELSLPQSWVLWVAEFLARRGISTIAGLEYRAASGGKLVNEAALCLVDGRLGYVGGLSYHSQTKRRPAHNEESSLGAIKETFAEDASAPRTIWIHGDHAFGLLVCSELSNVGLLKWYRGKVDSLFVLSWNKDLRTFGSLLEAAAFENHCCAVLANNSLYGDSRVRIPYAKSYRRDALRVRGGLDDYVVGANVPVQDLRRAHHGKDGKKLFQPLPDGFMPARWRP